MAHDERVAEFIRQFTAHEARLRAFSMCLIPNWADAEEVLQRASVVAWQKFEAFQPGSSFFSWASRILFLEAQNFRRAQAAEKVQFGDEFYRDVEHTAGELSEELAERQRLLGRCIAKLAPG